MEGTKPWTIKGGNAIERGWVRLWTGLYTLSFSLVLSTALFKAHKKKADTMDFGSSLLDVSYLESGTQDILLGRRDERSN